jgi:hypothetical protein
MSFLQAEGVEGAFDGVALQGCAGNEDRVRLKPVQFGLGAVVAPVDEDVRARVAVRIVVKGAHAILETAGM